MLKKLGRSLDHKRLLLGGLVVAGFAVLLPAAEAQSKPDKEAIARGCVTYGRYCVSCQGKEARGERPGSPPRLLGVCRPEGQHGQENENERRQQAFHGLCPP